MNIKTELEGCEDMLVVAKLAIAYSLLADAPYDSWRHEGSPAEMAVYVVKEACARGHMGFLKEMVLY